jgi:hypothetical protein
MNTNLAFHKEVQGDEWKSTTNGRFLDGEERGYHCSLTALSVFLTSSILLVHAFGDHINLCCAAVAARIRECAKCLRQEGAQWPLTRATTSSALASIPLPR